MSSSDEVYHTPGNSPKHLPEHSPEHSCENSTAEHAESNSAEIEPVTAPNTIYEYTRLEGDLRLGSPPDPDPLFYPVCNLKFDSATEPETSPTSIIFKRSPIPRPPNAETTPPGPTFLIDASFSTGGNSPPQENAAKFGLWIVDELGTKTIIPPGSWVFFPVRGAKS